MANFIVTLSMCGYRDGKHFTFIPARLRKEFQTLKQAQKYYNTIVLRYHFKRSTDYGVFLTIYQAGKRLQIQQIN